MTGDGEALSAVSERLQRVERHNRSLKWGMAVAVLLALASMVVSVGETSSRSHVIAAERFDLVNEDGRVLASLRMFDGPGLWLYDSEGRGRARLALAHTHEPFLVFFDADGSIRAALSTVPGGKPYLGLYDGNENVMWSTPDATPIDLRTVHPPPADAIRDGE